MDPQHRQDRLKEIQNHIDNFKKALADSESHYQMSLKLITHPGLSSSLTKQHVIHTKRQRAAIAKMESLYNRLQDPSVSSANNKGDK